MKLDELQISELEIWLADGPDIDEIVERFTRLEDERDNAHDRVAQLEEENETLRDAIHFALEAKIMARSVINIMQDALLANTREVDDETE